tara:strand:- start:1089 stop:1457 length:369 start_codon:yes stop_codon:yes gene_type:complete
LILDQKMLADSPLTLDEIQKIDATGLPSIDRHYLRLLAHCLACFKEMASGSSTGEFPIEKDRLKWLLEQPALTNERAFVFVLLEQFAGAAHQLERLAEEYKKSPLELTLDELINWSLRSRMP